MSNYTYDFKLKEDGWEEHTTEKIIMLAII